MRLQETINNCKKIHDKNYYESLDYNKLKTCSKCKLNLPISNFTKHTKQPDGFTYECRACIKNTIAARGINLVYHKHRAKKKGLDFNISINDIFLPTHCPILGLELTYGGSRNDASPSIDRIDNTKGYIKGNVIVMSTLANSMKNKANFEQLKLFSQNIEKLINNYKMQDALGEITDIFPEIKEFSLVL